MLPDVSDWRSDPTATRGHIHPNYVNAWSAAPWDRYEEHAPLRHLNQSLAGARTRQFSVPASGGRTVSAPSFDSFFTDTDTKEDRSCSSRIRRDSSGGMKRPDFIDCACRRSASSMSWHCWSFGSNCCIKAFPYHYGQLALQSHNRKCHLAALVPETPATHFDDSADTTPAGIYDEETGKLGGPTLVVFLSCSARSNRYAQP